MVVQLISMMPKMLVKRRYQDFFLSLFMKYACVCLKMNTLKMSLTKMNQK